VDWFCFDLKRRSIRKLNTQAWASGWWDASHILFQTTNTHFLLFDVATEVSSPFVTLGQIANLLVTNGISEDPSSGCNRRITSLALILRSLSGLRLIRIRPLLSVLLMPSTPMNDERLSTAGSSRITWASARWRKLEACL